MKLAYEKVVNQNNRCSKALVFYLDEMFKKDFKTLNELEVSESLDKIIQIFRFLIAKDVFEGFYKNSFAKRLLDTRTTCADPERMLVMKLKEECGFQFTQRLEQMYKDINMSVELNAEFRQKPFCKSLPLELNCKVLTLGHWPNDGKEQLPQLVQLPREISSSMTTFTQFYFGKYNNGRQLHWKMSMGTADVKGNFSNNRSFEFQTSSYQMLILLFFNDHPIITWAQMLQLTQI